MLPGPRWDRRRVWARPCLNMVAMKKSVAAMKSKKVIVKGALERLENHFGLGKWMEKWWLKGDFMGMDGKNGDWIDWMVFFLLGNHSLWLLHMEYS